MLIDKEIVEQARNTDIIGFIEKYHGFTFTSRGGEYRCRQHPSLAIKNDCRSFYWHSKGIGGYGVLDYLIKIENMSFREAVEVITGVGAVSFLPQRKTQQEYQPPKTLILPEKTGYSIRLYDYLCTKRGIDRDIVDAFIQGGKLYQDRRNNIVFVGHDEHGKARFACLRGIYGDLRMDCKGSDKRYGFCVTTPQTDRLYIYESSIDLMSNGSIENIITKDKNAWKRHNHLSLCGTSDTALPFFLNQHSFVKELVFCLDNDPAGRDAAVKMAREYANKGFFTRLELPTHKDCNEDLMNLKRELTRQKQPETHQQNNIAEEAR